MGLNVTVSLSTLSSALSLFCTVTVARHICRADEGALRAPEMTLYE